jgi:triosephosphate isomerase
MLKNLGVEYVIIGHSERRALGETDEMVNKKVAAALRARLRVILCVGESLSIRKRGSRAVLRYTRSQLTKAVHGIPPSLRTRIIVAYEPIWAIGTGVPCDADEAERMVRACAAFLAIKVNFRDVIGLYGGSVNARNAGTYLRREYIDGLLVGGASLKASEFGAIIRAARAANRY